MGKPVRRWRAAEVQLGDKTYLLHPDDTAYEKGPPQRRVRDVARLFAIRQTFAQEQKERQREQERQHARLSAIVQRAKGGQQQG